MRCQVFVAKRDYARPGPCVRNDAKIVRWAPTPLKTKVYRLCSVHLGALHRGKLKI